MNQTDTIPFKVTRMPEPSELFPKPSSPSTADQPAPAVVEASGVEASAVEPSAVEKSASTADERAADAPPASIATAEGHSNASSGSSVEPSSPAESGAGVIMPPPLVSNAAESDAKQEVITIVLPDPNSEPAKASVEKALTDDAVANDAPKPASVGTVCSVCGTRNRVGVLICEVCGNVLVNGEHGVGTKQFENAELQREKSSAATEVPAEAVPGTAELNAAKLSTSSAQAVEYNTMVAGAGAMGSEKFEKNMVLRLEIEAVTAPILVYPRGETKIGRRDPSTGIAPDVDLTAYAGYRMGVSRNHVVIKMKEQQLEVYDQGSSNGSMLNGSRLEPYKPQTLRNGDLLVLGKMSLRVTFQTRS